MSGAALTQNKEQELDDLKAKVLCEVLPAFRTSPSPHISEGEVQAGVELLFQLLAHRVGDLELDAVGEEIITGLRRWFHDGKLVKLADRYEPFCKFMLKVIDPASFAQLQAETNNRLSAAKVLKVLGLVSNKALSAFESCAWEQFPPADVEGQPDFLEHVVRTYVFRNVDDHQARVLNQRERAQIAESICVLLVWCVIKFSVQIRGALTTARFAGYLEGVRSRFAGIGTRFVELTTEPRPPEEYRFPDPLSTSLEMASFGEATAASKLPQVNRAIVIEAEPGAGKTMTLQFLAWQQADFFLAGKTTCSHVPVYIELKLLWHRGQTIEAAVGQALTSALVGIQPIPWESLLLLVDGMNEVGPEYQTRFKVELRDLLSRFSEFRTIVAGRHNWFRGEFEARIVVLQKLTGQQLAQLFRKELGDDAKAATTLESISQSKFLYSWAQTPLHAWLIARVTQQENLLARSSHAAIVRYCIRFICAREENQASAKVSRTGPETKEPLLARLGFETKSAAERIFGRPRARMVLANAQAQIGAKSLDLPRFIEEVMDNHLLQGAENEALGFAHELYHDYFAATELESREGLKKGLGTEFALTHFHDTSWCECIRLFAGFTKSSSTLIQRGVERNPQLAWVLLNDANLDDVHLRETVALAAYSVFEGNLGQQGKTALAAAYLPILANLGRADLVEQAIFRQREILEPSGLWKLEEGARQAAEKGIQEAMRPLGYGLLSILRLGNIEQRFGQEAHYSQAGRAAIRALKQIKAARVLAAILACWTGKSFDAASIMPGLVIDALIDLGVDAVLDQEIASLNKILAEWLCRASGVGFTKAWPAYGRVLRLARRPYVADAGLEFDGATALKWLHQSHETGDSKGTLELALLLVEEPEFGNEAGDGERMLRQLARTNLEARYELGLRLLNGEDLRKNETEGFEQLLSAAESGHPGAKSAVDPLFCGQFVVGPPPHVVLPTWAQPYQGRLKVLFPKTPTDLH